MGITVAVGDSTVTEHQCWHPAYQTKKKGNDQELIQYNPTLEAKREKSTLTK